MATPLSLDPSSQSERRQLIRTVMEDPMLSDSQKAHKIQDLFVSPKLLATIGASLEPKIPSKPMYSEPTGRDLLYTYQDVTANIRGCEHYQQSCKILTPCCGKWYTCRLCHDAVNDHEVDRYTITTMLCMVCKKVQCTAQSCSSCGLQMAQYYCGICHIWENKPDRPIYHCSDCKICRVGHGLEIDYFHCPTCDICMSMSMKGRHRCVEKSLHSNCPICFEYMFTSTKHVVFMRCGHSIHSHCYEQYRRTSYQCPLCSKSHQDMTEYFRAIDALMRKQPMPIEFSGWKSTVICNDCGVRSVVWYHFEYHKCPSNVCGSYNTNVLSIERGPPRTPAEIEMTRNDYGQADSEHAINAGTGSGHVPATAAAAHEQQQQQQQQELARADEATGRRVGGAGTEGGHHIEGHISNTLNLQESESESDDSNAEFGHGAQAANTHIDENDDNSTTSSDSESEDDDPVIAGPVSASSNTMHQSEGSGAIYIIAPVNRAAVTSTASYNQEDPEGELNLMSI